MIGARLIGRRMRGRHGGACLLALGLTGLLAYWLLPGSGAVSRAGEPSGPVSVQTDASVPAREVTMIGATPAEAGGGADETWGFGKAPSGSVVVRYSRNGGEAQWSLGPPLQDEAGNPLAGFALDTPQAFRSAAPSPLAGQMTADGAGALVGFLKAAQQVLLIKNPGGPGNAFRETKPVPEADLEHGELLFGFNRAPLIAPLDESGSQGGAFVVPVVEHGIAVEQWVLHWDGEKQGWSREPIEKPLGASSSEFRVLGIGASSPSNAWLIAQLSSGKIALFHRHAEADETPSWRAVPLKPGGEAGEPLSFEKESITIPGAEAGRVENQILTVTGQGVWIDGERLTAGVPTTSFFRPEAEGQGPSLTSWCSVEHAPPGTPPCEKNLPESLPSGPSRSIAWANPSPATPFGERVITGLANGVSLRLEGESFTRVLALGGQVGADYGASFSNPTEGWLGDAQLPVHVTRSPSPTRLTLWPAAFHHALLAVAAQPGAPVGAVSSEALAVGDLGEVARYRPGAGWLPETLFGAEGRPKHPRLRSVAWPVPGRAYAVGDSPIGDTTGAMWLWRGETGLWEPDPAAPVNFRGNLLGVAFDPTNPARGYAVGESGVLLRFGKSWTQDTLPAGEPPCTAKHKENVEEVQRCSSWANASFTSIAFAGTQALVAYRLLPFRQQSASYDGGLLVNDGSGWHIDRQAASVIGSGVPWTVAGLADGGAAATASGVLYERSGTGAPWQPTPTPVPGGGEPGSLALFREAGALRVIAVGGAPDTYGVESAAEAPPGFPPTLIAAYPLSSNSERPLLRQTATGWSDELHELNSARAPGGNWAKYDTAYQPDAVSAVLADPGSGQGWAVGGNVEATRHTGALEGVLDTADIARYRDGAAPPGAGTYAVTPAEGAVSFAIGGNAQCAAPCADRANAGVGPDVWLAGALAHAAAIPGLRGFLYTGPRIVNPRVSGTLNGPNSTADEFSYEHEFVRYAEVLGSSRLPAYAVGTPSDLNRANGEENLLQAFSAYPTPFGKVCNGAPGCESGYYTVESAGRVRVLMLDNTAEVDNRQLEWLQTELREAAKANQPAIVVGNADLKAQIAAGSTRAAEVRAALVKPEASASAYFYDSPEQNVTSPLMVTRRAGAQVLSESIPAFGSGTLGYVSFVREAGEFLGASGFLVGSVEVAKRNAASNRAPVTASLIPNIGELAMEAKDGLLLHRSSASLFAALARRPRSGNRSQQAPIEPDTDPYIPIPTNCVGTACASGIFPQYTFSSSSPEVGDFVKPNLASAEAKAVELGPEEKPVPDPQSGLFCAYNAGTTVVTVSAGGLTASLPVTVQAGSVRRPCGTTRLKTVSSTEPVPTPLQPSPQPTPAGSPPPSPVPLPPPPVLAPVTAPPPPRPPAARPTVRLPSPLSLLVVPSPGSRGLLAVPPPPPPTPARPTPPSGTSAVTQPVEAPEKEEEKEQATESVSNKASAYRADEHQPSPFYPLGVIVLAAFAGASIRRRPRRGRSPELRVAPATITTLASQRRMSQRRERRR